MSNAVCADGETIDSHPAYLTHPIYDVPRVLGSRPSLQVLRLL